VAPLSEADAVELFLDPDDLIPAALFLALAEDTPVAVASLRRGRSPGEVDLGWVGAVEAHRARGTDLAAALVGRCLRYAADEGWTVRVEVDEADEHLWRLTGVLPVVWEPDWLAFATAGPIPA
jgi:GNAT superfamily N-acetyltransferase